MPDFMKLFEGLNQTSEMFRKQNEQRNMPPVEWEFSSGKDGRPRAKFDMDAETAMNIHKAMENYGQIMASMQQEAGKLQQQEDRARQHPLLNVLAQVAGQLGAGDKRLPPVVSALGRSSLALNPTPDQLRDKRLGIEQEMGKLSEGAARVGLEGARFNLEAKGEARRLKTEEDRFEVEKGKLKETAVKEHVNFINKEFDRARQTQNYSDEDKKAFVAAGMEAFPGSKESDWKAAADRAQRLAVEAKVAGEQKAKREDQRDIAKADLQLRNRIAQIKAETSKQLTLQSERFRQQQAKAHENIPAKLREQAITLDVVEQNSKELRRLATEHPEYFGILGHARLVAEAQFDTTAADVQAAKEHLFAQLAKAYGGARGFAKVEQPVFRALAGGKWQNPEATIGTLDRLDQWVAANRASLSKQFPQLVPADAAPKPGEKVKKFNPATGKVE